MKGRNTIQPVCVPRAGMRTLPAKKHLSVGSRAFASRWTFIFSLLDSDAEVNILLYHVALALNLTIRTRVKVTMKDAESHKSVFLSYISNVSVQIEDVIVRQLFFILEKDINLCILRQSFKTATHMTWQTCNDRSVLIIIFDSENDNIQAIFQSYSSDSNDNKKRHKMMKTMTAQAVSKALNTKRGT